MAELGSTTSPAYVAQLALQAAPFNQTVETDRFFAGGQAGHRLNLLLHLIRASDKVVNLVAESGYGKSTLLDQLQYRSGDELRLCFIDIEQHTDLTAILGQCLLGLGVSGEEIAQAGDPIAVFKTRLEQLLRLNITPVMLIDNAHLLDESLSNSLVEWLNWRESDNFLIQGVFASTASIALPVLAEQRLQVVTLPALSETELPAYLLARLTSVGYRGSSPFSDKDVKRIFQFSAGCPAVVNQQAHQQLLGIKPVQPAWRFWDQGVFKLTRRWAGLGVIVLTLSLLLIFQEPLNAWFAASQPSQDEDTIVVVEEEAELPMVVAEEQAEREELADLIAAIPEPNQADGVVENVSPQRPVAVVLPTLPEPAESLFGSDWVMAQTPGHYTYQLMGSWEREEVDAFIEQYALVGDVAVFESMRNGQVWHVLIYGVFEDKQAALAAVKTWPAPLNTLPSWLRRFESVQQQIRNKVVMPSSTQ